MGQHLDGAPRHQQHGDRDYNRPSFHLRYASLWGRFRLGACPSNPSLRGKGDAGRCEAAGSKRPEAYSLEYVEDFFGPRTTQMPADRFAAVEWHDSDRLLG